MKLHRIRWLRGLFLRIFARVNPGDISIRHHYTKQPLYLHSFKHKGYWYHGKRREAETMSLFAQLIKPGHTVIEVGGHIGYVATYLASLVGQESGRVYVFEPGPNNLPYLRKNIQSWANVQVIEKAVGDQNGTVQFYVEELTGQNNSMLNNFTGYKENAAYAYLEPSVKEIVVDIIKLDDFVKSQGVVPHFIKIDVEGAELDVVLGMQRLLEKHHPMLMIEFNSEQPAIFDVLQHHDYLTFTPKLEVVKRASDFKRGNLFALSRVNHQTVISSVILKGLFNNR